MSDKRDTITLASATDAYNFRVCEPVELVYSDGQWRRSTRWESLRFRVARGWTSATRWWRPRTVCAAIDREAGTLTVTEQRWSWRRWKWER